ncbi:MAG: hypothetical protein PHU85_10175 [Phycisphaerae bacterium]|nr:hypothetical protein [Phycisphaerae bacterium]
MAIISVAEYVKRQYRPSGERATTGPFLTVSRQYGCWGFALAMLIQFRIGLSEAKARLLIQAKDEEREYLRGIYQLRYHRQPAFNVIYDCSAFTLAQIAMQAVHAMRVKGIL